MTAAFGTDSAGLGIAEDTALMPAEAGRLRLGLGLGLALGLRRRGVIRVTIEGLIAVITAEGDLARGRGQSGSMAGRGGQLGGGDVELDAGEEEAGGVEGGAVGFAPEVEERGGEIAWGGVAEGEDGGLGIPEFAHVGLEERDGFFR